MDPYDAKISIDKVLTQEKKWLDALNSTSVNVRDKDPVSAGCIAWMISKDMLLGSPIINAKEENFCSHTRRRNIFNKQQSTGRRWDCQDTTPITIIAP